MEIQKEDSTLSLRLAETYPVDVESPYQDREDRALPISVAFQELHCRVKTRRRGEYRVVLDNVGGVARPGEIMGIMGSSGSGKSTCLHMLSHRISRSQKAQTGPTIASGCIQLNGIPSTRNLFERYGAFVMQDDILLNTMTPREALLFAAKLVLPDHTTAVYKADAILHGLGLTSCADTVLGDPERSRLSGGERKRLGIGIELLSTPSILCLDEPLTGLDSFNALLLLQLLKRMASEHFMTIILTLHQPSLELYHILDSILLLHQGRCIYSGPILECRTYLKKVGLNPDHDTNAADFFIRCAQDMTAGDLYDAEIEKAILYCTDNSYIYESKTVETPDSDTGKPLVLDVWKRVKNPYWKEFRMLGRRGLNTCLRLQETTTFELLQVLFCALLVGGLFYDVGDTQASITSRKGALFEIMMNSFMISVSTIGSCFPHERPLYEKERSNNMYRCSTYVLSKIVFEFSFLSLHTLLYVVIVYWMVGLQNTLIAFCTMLLTMLLLANVGHMMGLALASAVSDPKTTLSLFPFVLIPLSVFISMFISPDDIPWYFMPMYWVSPFHYAYNILIVSEFSGLHFLCTSDELITTAESSICPYETGEDVIQALNLNTSSATFNAVLLLTLYVTFGVLSYLFLLRRKQHL